MMIWTKYQKLMMNLCWSILLILTAACQPVTQIPQPTDVMEESSAVTSIPDPTPTPMPTMEMPVEDTEGMDLEVETTEEEAWLPPEPISQTITVSDGTTLDGLFYPAAKREAPLLVMFHWAPGDQTDWRVVAAWLQNRGYQPELPDDPQPWLDPSWFPLMPEDFSFHILTFTFRGCAGGCQSFDREGWLLDAAAVMDHTQTLENADFSQVVTIGASIGADGAAYACHIYNQAYGGCQGALSLSPGGYLTIPYPEAVDDLGNESPSKSAWCVFSVGDGESASACENASGENYREISYMDSAHGMSMIEPGREPNPLEIILDFLTLTGLCTDYP